jgi:hypothetical protein
MTELELQKFTVALLKLNAADRVVWFAVPNGESRSARTGAKLKAMGVRPGVADLVIILPGGAAAFLELKAPGGRPSQHQKVFRTFCELNGAPYAVACSPEEVNEILSDWGAVHAPRHRYGRAA